ALAACTLAWRIGIVAVQAAALDAKKTARADRPTPIRSCLAIHQHRKRRVRTHSVTALRGACVTLNFVPSWSARSADQCPTDVGVGVCVVLVLVFVVVFGLPPLVIFWAHCGLHTVTVLPPTFAGRPLPLTSLLHAGHFMDESPIMADAPWYTHAR